MAGSPWTARIELISDAGDGEHVVVNVTYYDAADTQFASPLWTHGFSFEFGTPNAEMAAAIRTLGQQQRAVLAKVAAAQPLVLTTVTVP